MADSPALRRISTLAQLDEFLEESSTRPVWLFKHSLTCSISTVAWREFQDFVARQPDATGVAVIEIQDAREVSAAAAERTGVRHESPQAILIGVGRPLWHASHWEITGASLAAAAAPDGPVEAASSR